MNKVIVVCGPTASGKTSVSIDIAKHIGGEVVCADSMQIYKEMNIGTAKPSMIERDDVPHHMFDIVSVDEEYNVARYVEQAGECVDDIFSRAKIPVIVGGTGLYVDSFINNVNFVDEQNDPDYREELKMLAIKHGNSLLYSKLVDIDPYYAKSIHINDTKRIIRALEIFKSTGKTMTQTRALSQRERKYDPLFIALNYKDRQALYDRINKRVDIMLDQGLIEEVKDIMSRKLSSTARFAIGYREIIDHLNGECSLEDAVELIKKKSRNYAKRQITWFGRNDEINWFYPDNYSDYKTMLNDILKVVKRFYEV